MKVDSPPPSQYQATAPDGVSVTPLRYKPESASLHQRMTLAGREVFQNGKPLLFADTYNCSGKEGDRDPEVFEEWVKKLAAASGQRIDWHYSGGTVQVLYLGDVQKILAAVASLP